MTHSEPRTHHGPYRFVRAIEPSVLCDRWLALHDQAGTNHVVHHLSGGRDAHERRRLLDAFDAITRVDHPHLLSVESYALDAADGSVWIVTPYLGNQEGLVTLADHAENKGGLLSTPEIKRVLDHLLGAIGSAHAAGVHNGPLTLGDVLVDRRGSLSVEMYGLERRLAGFDHSNEFVIRDEVRSVIALAYTLLTGLPDEEPRVAVSRLDKKIERVWDRYFDRGLDATEGFASADEARGAMPGRTATEPEPARPRRVQTVLRKFRLAGDPAARNPETH